MKKMKHNRLRYTLILGFIFVASCSKQEKSPTELVTFPLRGEVLSLDTVKQRITIAHQEIPNYMIAMTMPFKVRDARLLRGIVPGDSVQGTLAVSQTESWLETLVVIGKGETPQTMSAEDVVMRRLFKIGEPLPDVLLTNHDGRRIRLSDFRGKVLAITFIYTRCPLPDFCIRMSEHFARLQKILKQHEPLNGKWHLLSISFDPTFDTPKVLKDYGHTYGADFATWDFATESVETILRLANGLDLTLADDEGLIQHNLRTVVVDQEGRLVNITKGNEWTPNEVAQEIRSLIEKDV